MSPSPLDLTLRPIPFRVARELLVREHYLHAFPGGTTLAVGVFAEERLVGAVTLGNGPRAMHRIVDGTCQRDFLVLSRLWLHPDCPRNSESHVLSLLVRELRRSTGLKFLVSYADPSATGPAGTAHVGYVYQAAGWTYVGLSHAMPLLDLGDGRPRHLRSVNSRFGTHSVSYLRRAGLGVRPVDQAGKHTYLAFVDRRWRRRLLVPSLPYPKPQMEAMPGEHHRPSH